MKDKWGFKMKADILIQYGGDVAFVNKLIAAKVKAGLWKRNPDAPNREDYTLYLVHLDTHVSNESISSWEMELLHETECESDVLKELIGDGGVLHPDANVELTALGLELGRNSNKDS